MKRARTEGELRHLLVADSIDRKRWLDRLLAIVRERTREATIAAIAKNTGSETEP